LEITVRADLVLLGGVVYFVGASTLGYCLVVEHLGNIDGSGRVGDRARSGDVSYRTQEGARVCEGRGHRRCGRLSDVGFGGSPLRRPSLTHGGDGARVHEEVSLGACCFWPTVVVAATGGNFVVAAFEAALGEGKVAVDSVRGADVVHATSELGGEKVPMLSVRW
jgi:hypothetical protein